MSSSQNIQEIEDEELLHKMMNNTDNFDERKKIRARLRDLREAKAAEYEKRRVEREKDREDAIQMKHRLAEADKQRKLKEFQEVAKQPKKEMSAMEEHIREKHAKAEKEKERKLEKMKEQAAINAQAYNIDADTLILEARQKDDFKEDAVARSTKTENVPGGTMTTQVTTTTHKTKDGSTVTTKQTKQITQTAGIGGTSYSISKTSAAKSSGPRGAMAAFKQMDSNNPKPTGGGRVAIQRSPSAIKEMLLNWCKQQVQGYEHVNITNFSSSWNDGMAFCALIHHFHPEAFDYSKLDPKKRRANFALAFKAAEKCADIAPLLEVEDMVRMKNPDWKCVFTYVQSFYRKFRMTDSNKDS